MSNLIKRLGFSIDLDRKELFKILLLAFTFFCVIGAYTVIKEMKDILFLRITGEGCVPLAKTCSMFLLIPLTLLYSYIIDMFGRFKTLFIYSLVYGITGLVISWFLMQSDIGLVNTVPSQDRLLGWFIYLFYEGTVPFVVSVFWAFANSVTSPDTARKGYTILIAGSKLGGMFTAGLAWFMMSPHGMVSRSGISDIGVIQFLLASSSLLLCFAPLLILFLLKTGSEQSLHGYEAAYKAEKEREESGANQTGIFSGLTMLGKQPYILAIFAITLFYEIINVVLSYQRLLIVNAGADSLADFTSEMFKQRFYMHALGFVISFFGTRVLVKKLGERACLLLMPLIVGVLLIYFVVAYNDQAVLVVFMALGMLNYAFSSPLREALYIPTVTDIKYKSKAWIDSFGTKISKFGGSLFNKFAYSFAVPGTMAFSLIYTGFFATTIVLWTAVAAWLGYRYTKAIKNNEVIGL